MCVGLRVCAGEVCTRVGRAFPARSFFSNVHVCYSWKACFFVGDVVAFMRVSVYKDEDVRVDVGVGVGVDVGKDAGKDVGVDVGADVVVGLVNAMGMFA